MSSRKPATLSDVAREAGVSPYTVSAVLNGARSNTRVSPATRQRILDSADRLRYRANAQARSLARQRTNILGVLFDVVESTAAIGNQYATGVLRGIVGEARRRGYDVLLYTEPWRDAASSAARYRDRRTDGVIVVAPQVGSDVLSGIAAAGAPVCAVSADPAEAAAALPPAAVIDVDNAAGVRLAVEHLLRLGHRRIAHLTGDADVYSAGARRDAFVAALAGAGVPLPDGYVRGAHYDATTVPEALDALLALPAPPTALVAGNDNIAIAVLNAARARGLSVPADLSVVGFDDVSAAAQVTPPLTTVRQPLTEIGAAAASALIARVEGIDGDAPDGHGTAVCLLPPELIVRASTAAPATPVTLVTPTTATAPNHTEPKREG